MLKKRGRPPKAKITAYSITVPSSGIDDKNSTTADKESTIPTSRKENSSVDASSESATTVNANNIDKYVESAESGAGAVVQQSDVEATVPETERSIQDDTAERPTTPSSNTSTDTDLQEFRGFGVSVPSAIEDFTLPLTYFTPSSFEALLDSQTSCEVRGESVLNRQSPEEHRAEAGHFKCVIPGCSLVKSSAADLTAHLSEDHSLSATDLICNTPKDAAGQPLVTKPLTTTSSTEPPAPQRPLAAEGPAAPKFTLRKVVKQPNSKVAPSLSKPTPKNFGLKKNPVVKNASLLNALPVPKVIITPMTPIPRQTQKGPIDYGTSQITAQTIVLKNMVPQVGTGAKKRAATVPQAAGRCPQPAKQRLLNVTPMSPLPNGNINSKTNVPNILKKRGITITPSMTSTRPQSVRATQPVQAPRSQPVRVQEVPTLNLTSSITITPVVAQNIRSQTEGTSSGHFIPARSPQPTNCDQLLTVPTIDLTVDSTPVVPTPRPNPTLLQTNSLGAGQGRRPRKQQWPDCPVCSKTFTQPDELALHLMSHVDKSTGKLAFKCNVCDAQYSSKAQLDTHKNKYHLEFAVGAGTGAGGMNSAPSSEQDFVVPIIDLRKCGGAAGLRALGIQHYIHLSKLERSLAVSMDTARKIAGESDPERRRND